MCFETDPDNEVCRPLAVVSSTSEAESWKQKTRDAAQASGKAVSDEGKLDSSGSEQGDEGELQHPSTQLSKLMTRFQETMSSYGPLVEFGMILMPSLRSHFIYNEMYKNANRHLEAVDSDQQFETYGITADQYPSVRTQIRRLREFDRGATVLPGAILLSLVATFDSFIADTIRVMLRCKPERVMASSKTIDVKEVLTMSSFDDLIGKIIENEVESLMRGSHDEQIKYLEDKLNIKIRSHYDGWGDFMEIFERRNLIAHGNDIVNSHYVRNCKKHGPEVGVDQVGERLSLEEGYLRTCS